MTAARIPTPAHLTGVNAPVTNEIEALNLPVMGALPPELAGRYFRNGPNPMPGVDPGHGFVGQGMLHGVRIAGGKARWYRNRWVRTPTMQGARPVNPDGTRNLAAGVANTSVLSHGGRILALVENALPYEVSADMLTLGPFDFDGRLRTPMTAHPKLDPETGELLFFGYDARPPFLTYHVVGPDGRLSRSEIISVTGPTMMHDFAVTKNYVVWLDLPVVFDPELARRRGMPYRWSEQYPARLGVMPRAGGSADVRWFPVAPGYAFHVANAYEEGASVTLEAVCYSGVAFNQIWAELGGVSMLSASVETEGPRLYRWQVDLEAGRVSEREVDDLWTEFPSIDLARAGRPHRYVYAVSTPTYTGTTGARIVKYDRATGARAEHPLDDGWVPGEQAFVKAQGGRAEDDGWLLSIVSHRAANSAQLLVLDASRVEAPPVAVVALPRRVPAGFHGAWIPDAAG